VPKAELVFASVVDRRLWEAQGEAAPPAVYTITLPGRALPFIVARYWKAPAGYATEWFELVAPSGKTAYRAESRVRRFPGQMDLTQIADPVEDATFQEIGVYAASFLVEGEIQGQVEFQLLLQAPTALPADLDDAVKKSDVIWVGEERNGRDRAVPVWFAYHQGRIYVIHSDDRDSGEQQIPGLPDASELVVVTRHKYRDTRAGRFHAAVRLIDATSAEFDGLAGILADRRRDRHGAPQDAIRKWKQSCVIAELTPAVG
jgi:hypothetical protein